MAMENSTYQLYFKNSKLLINSTSLNSDNVNFHLIKKQETKNRFFKSPISNKTNHTNSLSDNIINKHYFSDQDKKKNKNDSPISIKEYKAKNSLSYINKDNVLSTNSCSINSTKFLPKVRVNNLIEKDDSMKINKTQNIINIVNNMNGEDKKKINLKMNINKYNIKYYVSENKLEKFLQNIKLKNKTLTSRNNKLSINNFFKEVNRPNSSKEKKIKTKINISNSNIKRGLSIDRKSSEKKLLDNISNTSLNNNNNINNKIYNFTKYTQLNKDLNYNSSSPRIKKKKFIKKNFQLNLILI